MAGPGVSRNGATAKRRSRWMGSVRTGIAARRYLDDGKGLSVPGVYSKIFIIIRIFFLTLTK
jgi:hypothetical protein